MLLTVGFTKQSRRQIKVGVCVCVFGDVHRIQPMNTQVIDILLIHLFMQVWDLKKMDRELKTLDIDQAAGVIMVRCAFRLIDRSHAWTYLYWAVGVIHPSIRHTLTDLQFIRPCAHNHSRSSTRTATSSTWPARYKITNTHTDIRLQTEAPTCLPTTHPITNLTQYPTESITGRREHPLLRAGVGGPAVPLPHLRVPIHHALQG